MRLIDNPTKRYKDWPVIITSDSMKLLHDVKGKQYEAVLTLMRADAKQETFWYVKTKCCECMYGWVDSQSAGSWWLWYKIGWLENDAKIYWSSYEFYKISCETGRVEQYIFETHSKINIFEYHAKKIIQFYHYFVQNLIFLYFEWYHITDRFFWHLISSEHDNE